MLSWPFLQRASCLLFFVSLLYYATVNTRSLRLPGNPLFCCLELIGFMLTYASVMLMIGIPTATSCIVTPVAFSLGFILVIGNMIAKNYRIYRIFNNIFITRNVITDSHLIRTVFVLVGLDVIILVVGLLVARPVPSKFEVSYSSHYWSCEPQGNNKIVFLVLTAIYAACLLLFATFLAYKTRFAGKQYSRYSECKQMGLSVYNILFSALVGFAVVVNPLADFYTKYYIEVIAVLWATSFSLLVLFLPKLQAFFRIKLNERKQDEGQEKPSANNRKTIFSFLKSTNATPSHLYDRQSAHGNELLSLEQILASDNPVLDDDDDEEDDDDAQLRRRKPSAASSSTTPKNGQGNFIEVHEGEMPIRKVFRYFPWLSQWEMHHIMVFPWLGYFSHFSKHAKKGTVMSYSHVSVYSTKLEDYVLKIHGQGWSDMYIQLPSLNSLQMWEQCFSQKKPDYLAFLRQEQAIQKKELTTHHPHDMLASSMSQDHLLRRLSDQSEEDLSNANTMIALATSQIP
ncbi:7 transmembrane sweet-taste receptor of 3 GCPR-domain-containing protein [Gilbertella persicaria]|uniref:7 transmembrane sweet-taste receptor of 3 GCPR-domain-containing protein n=1 Tax=Gilbertella persicaria TaxID=101096 RepID=UPI0022201E94|nr:7 transmembrane sweet-taste receptor of 3 GCPR-domain-containing protein [Gilbertella persicaria]KAI8098409.1 7 transmembrane sweet-taste receptor of 3 GCPR-domain-containing protein [Gilbertella persicaria]